jgi:poly(3-hydroxybutyrate) depolymerase
MLGVGALSLGMVAGGGAVAAQAESEAPDGVIVQEQLATGHELLVYVPDDPGTGLRARSTAMLFVLADRGLTGDEALAMAESSGLADIAEAERGVVAFINPLGDSWAAADTAALPATLARFDGTTGQPYADEGKLCRTSGGQELCRYPGMNVRTYLFGDRSGADFISQHVVPGITFDADHGRPWTPAAVYLSNPTQPAVAPEADIEIPAFVVNGSAEVNASYERLNTRTGLFGTAKTSKKAEFHHAALRKGYDEVIEHAIQRRFHSPAQLHTITDFKEAGLRVDNESLEVNGASMEYVEYVPRRQHRDMPLVLVFHGGSDHAEYIAWAAGWTDMAAEHGFMVVSVDQHGSWSPTDVITLLDHLVAEYPRIDESRVYATGFSLGAAKSWGLFHEYPERFAGLAPMGGTGPTPIPGDVVVPTIYFAGMQSPLAERPHQSGTPNNPDARVKALFTSNGVTDDYSYDSAADPVWGFAADASVSVVDDRFPTVRIDVDAYTSGDGNIYTALAAVHGAKHETLPSEGEVAWGFLSQFSRSATGDVVIEGGAFDLSKLGGSTGP